MTTRVLAIGAAFWDVIGRAARPVTPGDDLPGTILRKPGGVAVNIARALARQGLRPTLLSAVGRDAQGEALIAALEGEGIGTGCLYRDAGVPTDAYVVIEDAGGLVAAVADSRGLDAAGAAILQPLRDGRLASAGRPFAGAAVIDGNLAPDLLLRLMQEPGLAAADLRVVPASPAKAERLRPLLGRTPACLCLNRREAEAICGTGFADAASAVSALLSRGVRRAIVTDGARAAAEASTGERPVEAVPPHVPQPKGVTGAGDTALAAHLAAELSGAGREAALTAAVTAAAALVGRGPQ